MKVLITLLVVAFLAITIIGDYNAYQSNKAKRIAAVQRAQMISKAERAARNRECPYKTWKNQQVVTAYMNCDLLAEKRRIWAMSGSSSNGIEKELRKIRRAIESN